MQDEAKTKIQLIDELGQIRKRVAELGQVEEALRQSEEQFRQFFENEPEYCYMISLEGIILNVNTAALEVLGYQKEELVGKSLKTIYAPESLPKMEQLFAKWQEIGKFRDEEIVIISKEGDRRNVLLSVDAVVDRNGKISHSVSIQRDITERKWAEEELREYRGHLEEQVKERTVELEKVIKQLQVEITERKRAEELIQVSLREKEMLLKEIHHRVKNNLQVISSLIDMGSMRVLDQQVIDVYTDARARIHTMALIHSQLYRSGRFDQVNMESHIRELVKYLLQVYAMRSRLITPVIEHSDVYLPIIQAIPCALVLNEIISNVFRHAFEEGQKGTLEISTQRSADDTILIRIKDDGIGLPEEIDINTANTLGLKLIRNLVQEELMGRIQVERDKGTEIKVEFPILKEEVEHA